ncbi:hypothetical protein GA0115252_10824 [Streptomyces sp. DfronAA-171]|nr:hypothetical protein GA0115252_10824 [Streptomyces sp. DfronAA-171]
MQPFDLHGDLGDPHPREVADAFGDPLAHRAALGTEVARIGQLDADPDARGVAVHGDGRARGARSRGYGAIASRAACAEILATTRSAIRVAPRSAGSTAS